MSRREVEVFPISVITSECLGLRGSLHALTHSALLSDAVIVALIFQMKTEAQTDLGC